MNIYATDFSIEKLFQDYFVTYYYWTYICTFVSLIFLPNTLNTKSNIISSDTFKYVLLIVMMQYHTRNWNQRLYILWIIVIFEQEIKTKCTLRAKPGLYVIPFLWAEWNYTKKSFSVPVSTKHINCTGIFVYNSKIVSPKGISWFYFDWRANWYCSVII